MIQRKQSIYLLIITIVAVLLLVIDPSFYNETGKVAMESGQMASIDVDVQFTDTNSDGVELEQNLGLIILICAIGFLSFITIFLYKKRKVQLYLVMINFVLILALFANMYWYSLNMSYADVPGARSFLPAALSPISFILFNFLARNGIIKDEKLVRSLDRLR